MKKKNILAVLCIFFAFAAHAVTTEEIKLAGTYICSTREATDFLKADLYYKTFYLVLFEDGRYVKYTRETGKTNPEDIRYQPGSHGTFHARNGFLYLEPLTGLFEIFLVKKNALYGTYTEKTYIKQLPSPVSNRDETENTPAGQSPVQGP